jgi:phosphoglycolate phosphatase-like HAD superfamily hydrolase
MEKQDRAVIYDWDGTTADSLKAHLDLLQDLAKRYNASGVPEPGDIDACRDYLLQRVIHRHVLKWGAPQAEVENVRTFYSDGQFPKDYPYDLFPGIKELMIKLDGMGFHQAILSYNHKGNILPVLKKNRIQSFMFDDIADYDWLEKFHDFNKTGFLNQYWGMHNFFPSDVWMIGDTHWDHTAAAESGVRFIGVNYGWGRFQKNNAFPVVESVQELEEVLLEQS